jgi:DNA glycosylase AlkZ-like
MRKISLQQRRRAMYERRSLVRWMAMRRTLFVFPRAEVPVVQAALPARLRGHPCDDL